MGSHISIHNDTSETVMVKIGDDEAALRIAGIIGTAFGAVAAVISGVGWAVGAVSGGLITIVPSTALLAAGAAVKATGVTLIVLGTVRDQFVRDGYTELKPGQSYTSVKMTLSLWRQCHVVKAYTRGNRVIIDNTYMRPIFSGATDGSIAQHDIKFWVNKYPYERLQEYALTNDTAAAKVTPPTGRAVTIYTACGKCLDVPGSSRQTGVQMQQWESNGTNAQKFWIESAGGGYFYIKDTIKWRCVDIEGWGRGDGTRAHLWDYTGGDNQQFAFYDCGDGWCEIAPKHTEGMRLDVTHGSKSSGAGIQLYSRTGTHAQMFKVVAC